MVNKLRKTMGIRDKSYHLDNIIEIDEGFFESVGTELPKEDEPIKLKRGRGSQKQSKVIVVMSSSVQALKAPEKHKSRQGSAMLK